MPIFSIFTVLALHSDWLAGQGPVTFLSLDCFFSSSSPLPVIDSSNFPDTGCYPVDHNKAPHEAITFLGSSVLSSASGPDPSKSQPRRIPPNLSPEPASRRRQTLYRRRPCALAVNTLSPRSIQHAFTHVHVRTSTSPYLSTAVVPVALPTVCFPRIRPRPSPSRPP